MQAASGLGLLIFANKKALETVCFQGFYPMLTSFACCRGAIYWDFPRQAMSTSLMTLPLETKYKVLYKLHTGQM